MRIIPINQYLLTLAFCILAILCSCSNDVNDISSIPLTDPSKPFEGGDKPSYSELSGKSKLDLSCLKDDNTGTSDLINLLSTIDEELTNVLGDEVTLEEEVRLGEQFHDEFKKENRFLTIGYAIENIKEILKNLTRKLGANSKYTYSIYLIESNDINAFTIGSKIYITSAFYKFCKSNDEIAVAISHEIYHNELGHTKQLIQKQKALPEEFHTILSMLTISFGQKKELECDLYGIDLAIQCDYDVCSGMHLMKRLKAIEARDNKNPMESFFRSHPYSDIRASCIHSHLENNYNFNCPNE